MDVFRLKPLSEDDINEVIQTAGGIRAHPNHDRRVHVNADYLLGDALIELKLLEDEGFDKHERQTKLASLFRPDDPNRPVIVIDRKRLLPDEQRQYDRILEGPIKTAVASARKQLKQSRSEFPSTETTILFVINNGYTSIDHESLLEIVAHRVRNDTKEIDGIIVAGCYFHSDTFDSYFLWNFDYLPIHLNRPFKSEEALKQAWDALANKHMTALITQETQKKSTKGAIKDIQFDIDGVTYIKPAPQIGVQSEFFIYGRPRTNTSGLAQLPPVATTFADLTFDEWKKFREGLPLEFGKHETYEAWKLSRTRAAQSAKLPFVATAITWDGWLEWRKNITDEIMPTAASYANTLFVQNLFAICESARERKDRSILPLRFILVITEEIGHDRANDVSHIAEIYEAGRNEPLAEPIIENARMFHEHALLTAGAYALSRRIAHVMWQKDMYYAWH